MTKTSTNGADQLANAVNNMPSFQPAELETDPRLKRGAEDAISKYLDVLSFDRSPMFYLHVLLRKPHLTEEGRMVYDSFQIEWLGMFLEDIRKLLINPEVSQILVEMGHEPSQMAIDIDRLIHFFKDINGFEPRAHMKLYDLQRWDTCDYTNEQLEDMKKTYTQWAKIELMKKAI
ncbi:hypothetical protein SAMN05444008_11276 [Cnuella takakiae]|uniref:Uncharacterized protein n=1 Tax=Cnuella takakiae TaxID=1302690 RepID=A0A1M5EJS0_9BACT|nr:hypothetical protein [Cnuella takakiae]OLY91202.1 hypothetical protein BUE76_04280 [Cnuella takakiae]SHF79508.1 hypothetical protein SAMN05444008_11276 [Cnuella takakiae]